MPKITVVLIAFIAALVWFFLVKDHHKYTDERNIVPETTTSSNK